MLRAVAKSLLIHLINVVCNLLPSDSVSMKLRPKILSVLGGRFGPGVAIAGDVRMLGGNVEIGARAFINRFCYFDLTEKVTIGDDAVIGHHVKFITAGHEVGPSGRRCGRLIPKPIVIGSGTWIGAGVTILPGVEIGSGAVVGGGAVVTNSIPADSLALGVPARVVRSF